MMRGQTWESRVDSCVFCFFFDADKNAFGSCKTSGEIIGRNFVFVDERTKESEGQTSNGVHFRRASIGLTTSAHTVCGTSAWQLSARFPALYLACVSRSLPFRRCLLEKAASNPDTPPPHEPTTLIQDEEPQQILLGCGRVCRCTRYGSSTTVGSGL